jgi:hypothetical protein
VDGKTEKTDRQTDITKLIVASRKFAKAPSKEPYLQFGLVQIANMIFKYKFRMRD